MVTSFSPGGSRKVCIILDSVFCEGIKINILHPMTHGSAAVGQQTHCEILKIIKPWACICAKDLSGGLFLKRFTHTEWLIFGGKFVSQNKLSIFLDDTLCLKVL